MDNLESSRSSEFSKILQLLGNGAYGDPGDGDSKIESVWGSRSVQLFGNKGQEIAECGFDVLIKNLGAELKLFTYSQTPKKGLNSVEVKKVEVLTKLFLKISECIQSNQESYADLNNALAQEMRLFNTVRQSIPPGENHEILTSEQALQKANILAEEGNSIFEISNGGVGLASGLFHSSNRSIEGYTEFPAIKMAFHEFVKTNYYRTDPSVLYTLFIRNNDLEGIKTLNDINIPNVTKKKFDEALHDVIESAIRRSDKSYVKTISQFVPMDEMLTTNLFSLLQTRGSKNAQKVMIESGYSPTKNELAMMESEHLFFKEIENKFPILKAYEKFQGQVLGAEHMTLYGTQDHHEYFLETMQGSVLVTLADIFESRRMHTFDPLNSDSVEASAPKQNPSFRNMLLTLSGRRYCVAKDCATKNFKHFNQQKRQWARTPYEGSVYQSYVGELEPKACVKISINSNEYKLTTYDTDYKFIVHCYVNFWEENDPVFLKTEALFQKIACNTYDNVEDLRKDIAEFHWLFANIVPFIRGTASTGEVLTDALWLSHGYLPEKDLRGIDLKALTTPDLESFVNMYPAGKRPEGEEPQ